MSAVECLVADLTGSGLDLLVGQALDLPIVAERGEALWDDEPPEWLVDFLGLEMDGGRYDTPAWRPSTDMELGMKLIFSKKIAVFARGDGWCAVEPGKSYDAEEGAIRAHWLDAMKGATPMEAGCRLIAWMAFGDVVLMPKDMAPAG